MGELNSSMHVEPQMRSYQKEMLSYALTNNVIVFLDTGTGKTRVAVELIRQYVQEGTKKAQLALFLAPSVPLAMQQADVLIAAGMRATALCGELCQERWTRAKWAEVCFTHTALVMTPDAAVNALMHAMLKMDSVALLVLDEAHHSRSNHAYAVIMEAFYHSMLPHTKPRVLGLTASPDEAQTLQQVTGSLLVAPRDMEEVAALVPRAQAQWLDCSAGSLAATNSRLEAAVQAVRQAYKVISDAAGWAYAKDMMVIRARFDEATHGEQAQDGATCIVEQAGPNKKDLDHVKKQVGGLLAALEQLGPWGAAVVLALDLLSALHKLPDTFDEMRPYMLAELIDEGDLGPRVAEAQDNIRTLETALASDLSSSAVAGCRDAAAASLLHLAWQRAGSGSPPPAAPPGCMCLEEAALLHTLMTCVQALAYLLAASPADAEAIVSGLAGAAAAASADGVSLLLVLAEGGLQHLGQAVLQLVPPDALQHQVLGLACGPNSPGRAWLQASSTELVDPKVVTAVRLVLDTKHEHEAQARNPAQPAKGAGPYMGWGALVFSERKTTCLVLDQLFATLPALKAPAFATSMFVGNTDLAKCAAPLSMSQNQQQRIRSNFSMGHLNILFATSVGSEGLDFRHCQFVLAFDQPNNVVSLVQSGGRARAHGARYTLLGDEKAVKSRTKLQKNEQKMRSKACEAAALNMASIDRGQSRDHVEDTRFMSKPRLDGSYRVPSTGAVVLSQHAQIIIEEYCRSLPGNNRWSILQPYYAFETVTTALGAKKFACTLYLPNNAATRMVKVSCWDSNKSDAKKRTCIEAVELLHKAGALDDYLKPTFGKNWRLREVLEQAAAAGDAFEHIMPKVNLTMELPQALAPTQQGQHGASAVAGLTSLHLYTFECSQHPEEPYAQHAGHSFGLLLPQPLPPCEDLPAFQVQISESSNAMGTSSSTARWGQAKLQHMGSVQLTAAQLKCLDSCQDVYAALMQDAASPSSEPWSNTTGAAAERLASWRSFMRLPLLEAAVQGLELGQHSGAELGRNLWYMVPLADPSSGAIDWPSIKALAAGPVPLTELPEWSDAAAGGLVGAPGLQARLQKHGLVVAMHSGKLHVAAGLCVDMTPGSTFPEESVGSYADYFKSRWGVRDQLSPQQPMLAAELSSGRGRVNVLPVAKDRSEGAAASGVADVPAEVGQPSPVVHLVPQLVALHPLGLQQWRQLHQPHASRGELLTAHQLLQNLREQSAGRYLPGLALPQAVSATLSAITSSAANDGEHSLELPELMGDALLKYAASAYIYLTSADDAAAHEGALSAWRDRHVANEVLLRVALGRMQLRRFYRAKPFDLLWQLQRRLPGHAQGGLLGARQQVPSPSSWGSSADHGQVDGSVQAGEATADEASGMQVKGKRLADCVEALVGVHCWHALRQQQQQVQQMQVQQPQDSLPATLIAAVDDACSFMAASRILPEDLMDRKLDHRAQHTAKLQQSAPAGLLSSARDMKLVESVQSILQYQFLDAALAVQSLTHCSYPWGAVRESYQRLEFLGDAVLGLVVTLHVLSSRDHRCLDSGMATELRSQLVSNEALAATCLTTGLYRHLRVGYRPLADLIKRQAGRQQGRGGQQQQQGDQLPATAAESSDAEDAGTMGRSSRSAWSAQPESEAAPKVLADVVEALVGAVYLDSGGDLAVTGQVVMHLLNKAPPQIGQGSTPHAGSAAPTFASQRLAAVAAIAHSPPPRRTISCSLSRGLLLSANQLHHAHCRSTGPGRPCHGFMQRAVSAAAWAVPRLALAFRG